MFDRKKNIDGPAFKKIKSETRSEISEEAKIIFVIHEWNPLCLDFFVNELSKKTKEKVSWAYFEGKPHILAKGNLAVVSEALKEKLPELNKKLNAYAKASATKNFPYSMLFQYTAADVDYWMNKKQSLADVTTFYNGRLL